MKQNFKREQIADGIYFSSVTDPKFKHNRVTASLVLALNREDSTVNALVPFLLRRGCARHPDFTSLNRELNRLYGASLSCDVSRFGQYQVLEVSILSVDDRYTLDKQPLLAQCTDLLLEILTAPNLKDGLFDKNEVELEKQQLKDLIESQINEKRIYAINRCRAEMCKGESIATEKYGYIEDAEKITPEMAADAYRRIMDTAQIEIMHVGSGNPETARKLVKDVFAGVKRAPMAAKPYKAKLAAEKVNEVTETMDVAQAKLVLGMRSGDISDDKRFAAMRMMVALYGGTPNSRLFLNVREKLSLCYYCAARFDRLTGIIYVDSGVEDANKEKAYKEIMNQLQVMQDGKFEEEELSAARLLMQNAMRSVSDSLGALDEWYMTQVLCGDVHSPDEEREMLAQVTREEIVEAAKQVTLDTVYLLTGKEG